MKDRVFLDSNIILYCYAIDEPEKRKTALNVAQNPQTIVSTQVLQGVSNILKKKIKLPWDIITNIIDEIIENNEVAKINISTLRKAIQIAERYQLQWFDSIIVASALEADCKVLFSEDLQHLLKIETLLIKNPFVK